MVKIGIYIDDEDPVKGGATTLLTTIKRELDNKSSNYEIVFFYRGGLLKKYKTVINKVEYINVDAGRRKNWVKLNLVRIYNSLSNIVRCILLYNKKCDDISYLDEIAKSEKIDLIWFTFPVLEKITTPYIYTIWDLGHRVLPMFPEINDNWNMREKTYSSMIYHASYIITGNQQGKREILDNYCVNPQKIFIAPFPLSFFCKMGKSHPIESLPEKYFIYPAQFWPHKNHIIILKALKILKKVYKISCPVIFTGSDKGNRRYIEQICNEMELNSEIIFMGFVSYGELKYLYENAIGMIYASILGPNNLPLYEASYLKCPVITTDIPGHKEQLGEAAIYYNKFDESQLAEAMYYIYTNKNNICDKIRKEAENIDYEYKYITAICEIFDEFEKCLRTWKR